MADIPAIDVASGQPTQVPQEAAAAAYRSGKIRFAPGTSVPITWQGQSWSVPGEQVDTALQNGAELDVDPTGAVKAAAAGAARGVSLGASDWLAIEGTRLLHGDDAAERTRQQLQGLREEHPAASMGAEAAGAIAPMLVPGAQEAEGAELLAGAGEGASGAEAAHAAAQIRAAADQATAVARADEASGRTVGSALGSLFRHANPNEIVGRIGEGAEDYIGRLFGESGLAGPAGTLGRWTAEGAIVGAANAADESELGDTDLTGESLFASMEHGALWGSALGLVGAGVERGISAAGSLAARVAEGRLGASAGQYRSFLARHGPGTLGMRSLEEGIERPFATGAQKYERAQEVVERDGRMLDGIVREADPDFNGASAPEVVQHFDQAVDEAVEKGRIYGANLDAAGAQLKSEIRKGVGWHDDPAPPEPLPDGAAERLYQDAWQREGLIDPSSPAPPPVTGARVRARWRDLADEAGLGTKLERPAKRLRPADLEAYRQKLVAQFQATRDVAEKQRLGVVLGTPTALEEGALQDVNAAVAARNSQRSTLRDQAARELDAVYQEQRGAFEQQMQRHEELRAAAGDRVSQIHAERDRTYAHMVSAVRRSNQELRVPIAAVRGVRSKIDEVIPYNRASDALTNAAVELKKAARRSLESRVEASMDRAARDAGKPELFARYVHAKARYGQAKDIEAALERQRAREVSRFGREVFGHSGGIVGHAITGLVFGHPLGGAAAGVARQYAPTLAAFLAHKVARFAEMRALRTEIQIAMRRSARAAVTGDAVPRFASIEVPDLPPHAARATAAAAMNDVLRSAKGTDLGERLAAL